MEIFTLITALIGALGTVYTIISALFFNKPKLNIEFKYLTYFDNRFRGYIMIENKSRLSISISNIYFESNGEQYNFELNNKDIKLEPNSMVSYSTQPLPFYLQPLGSVGHYFCSVQQHKLPELDTPLKLVVCTNRRNPIYILVDIHQYPPQSGKIFLS